MALRGLYYPYIHFQDTAWLKSAVLYWDQIGRIVPGDGYELHDDPGVELLRNHKNSHGEPDPIVDEFYPQGAEDEVGQAFLQLVTECQADLAMVYTLDHRDSWPSDPYTASAAPDGTDDRLSYVMVKKLSEELITELVRSGLGTVGEAHRDGWLGMHPRLVNVYMTALAEVMGRRNAAHPTTKDSTDFVSIDGLEVERLAQALLPGAQIGGPARDDREVEAAMFNIAVESVVPSGLMAIPMDEVIDMRDSYTAERVAFRDGVANLVGGLEDLDGLADAAAFSWYLGKEYEHRVEPALEALRQKLKDNKIGAARSVVGAKLALPPALASVAGLTADAVPLPAAVGFGAVWAVYEAWRSKRIKDREQHENSWVSYLLRIEHDVKPDAVVSDVLTSARKFRPQSS